MEMSNEIVIQAPAEVIFRLASETERWPEILPHYRWVRRIKGTDRHKLVEMAARRDFGPLGYPVRWTAEQRNLPGERAILFKHVRGISRGMNVEWSMAEQADGTHVRIWHEFRSGLPLVGDVFAREIVGKLFVHAVAGRTLRRIKELAEAEASATEGAAS